MTCARCGIRGTKDYPLDMFGEHMRRDICIKLLLAERDADVARAEAAEAEVEQLRDAQ